MLVLAALVAGPFMALSPATLEAEAAGSFVAVLVQTIDTSLFSPPSPDPSGIVYLGATDRLLISDSEVNEIPALFTGNNVYVITLTGPPPDPEMRTTTSFSSEPTGVTLNLRNGHLFYSDDVSRKVYEVDPGSDQLYHTPDDIVTSFSTAAFGSNDPEGVTYDRWQGVLFIADGANNEVYRVSPGANGVFDGVSPTGDDTVSSFDTAGLGILDPEGIAHNSRNDRLYIIGEPRHAVAEVTKEGTLFQMIDVSAADARNPAGLAYAPGSQDPTIMHLYIAARGVDNNIDPDENDGRIYEMTLPADPPPVSTVYLPLFRP